MVTGIHAKGIANPETLAVTLDGSLGSDAVGNLGGFTPKIVKRASNVISILSYVSAGQGVAIVSQGFKKIDMPNVVYREFDTETPPMGPIAFVYRRDDLSPAENALIGYVKAHASIT